MLVAWGWRKVLLQLSGFSCVAIDLVAKLRLHQSRWVPVPESPLQGPHPEVGCVGQLSFEGVHPCLVADASRQRLHFKTAELVILHPDQHRATE